jgi:hypothetical protein
VFAEPVRLTTDLEIQTLVAADFDADGDQDLGYSDDDAGTVCIWIVDEFPEPAPRCWNLESVVPTHMAAGDLDGDGVAEVAFADSTAAEVWIWDVDLAADVPTLLPLSTPFPADLVELVDLQGDGALDVLAGHIGSRSFSVRLAIP